MGLTSRGTVLYIKGDFQGQLYGVLDQYMVGFLFWIQLKYKAQKFNFIQELDIEVKRDLLQVPLASQNRTQIIIVIAQQSNILGLQLIFHGGKKIKHTDKPKSTSFLVSIKLCQIIKNKHWIKFRYIIKCCIYLWYKEEHSWVSKVNS